jgi:hypothetical protein
MASASRPRPARRHRRDRRCRRTTSSGGWRSVTSTCSPSRAPCRATSSGRAAAAAAAHAAGLPVVVGGRAFAGASRAPPPIGADLLADTPQRSPTCPRQRRGRRRAGGGPAPRLPHGSARRRAAGADDTAFPVLATACRARERTREDVRWILRFTVPAVLTDDAACSRTSSARCCASCTDASRTRRARRAAEVADGIERHGPRTRGAAARAVHRTARPGRRSLRRQSDASGPTVAPAGTSRGSRAPWRSVRPGRSPRRRTRRTGRSWPTAELPAEPELVVVAVHVPEQAEGGAGALALHRADEPGDLVRDRRLPERVDVPGSSR